MVYIFLLLCFHLKLFAGPFVPDALVICVIIIFQVLFSLILRAKALNDNDDNDEQPVLFGRRISLL